MHNVIRFTLLLMLLTLAACSSGAPTVAEQSAQAGSAQPPTTTTAPPTTAPSATSAPTATFVPTTEATPTTTAPTATAPTTGTATAAASATAAITTTAGGSTTLATPAPTSGTTSGGIAIRPDLLGKLAFVRGNTIMVYQPQTGMVKTLIENGREPQFSRDGMQIAFVRDDGLYLAGADGSNVRQIAAQPNVSAPRWTDDGSKIVFQRVVDPASPGSGEIWTIELPGGDPLKIATGADPAWAPDGKRLAYVSAPSGQLRRNQLRLTNWRGQNDWGPVKNLPANVPPIGIPGNQLPPAQLEHLMFAPTWDATGKFIYVPSLAASQVETDFTILERADATNGGSVYVDQLTGVMDMYGSPDRKAAVLTTGSARGDVQLKARPLDPNVDPAQYAWAETKEVAIHDSPAWAPTSDAVATIRCALDTPNRCDLVLLKAGLTQPAVLIPDLLGGQPLNRIGSTNLTWAP